MPSQVTPVLPNTVPANTVLANAVLARAGMVQNARAKSPSANILDRVIRSGMIKATQVGFPFTQVPGCVIRGGGGGAKSGDLRQKNKRRGRRVGRNR
jgi:hypothetical protein